jgi:hypothetical protein
MAHNSEMGFPTEWAMCDAVDDKRDYEEKYSEYRAKEPTRYRGEPPNAHSDTVGSQGSPAADVKVKRAAA